MKLISIILSIILAGSTLGYGIQVSAQTAGSGICGDHPCASGEVYTPSTPSGSGITVTTDKSSYNYGDTITISGTTSVYLGNTIPLTLILRDPVGNIVIVHQLTVGTDKTFSDIVTTTAPQWQRAGTYTISVQYGGPTESATTTFQFSGYSGTPSGPSTFPVDGTVFSITYTITNAQILDIKADIQSSSLTTQIQTSGSGTLAITLPRELIDAKNPDGTDKAFVVLNNDQTVQFTETNTTNIERTLIIPFESGAQQIEIIGTLVVGHGSTTLSPPASTPTGTITVTTDKSSYSEGDKIMISGTTSVYLGNTPLTLILTDPIGHTVKVDQITVGTDDTFSETVVATGTLWQSAGTYTISATYGGTNMSATTTFQFSGSSVATSGSSTVPNTGTNSTIQQPISSTTQSKIPAWVKNIFIWYGRGSISDDELIGAIQFLISQGIIHLK